MKSYAGIGSRKTPITIQSKMTEIAKALSRSDYCLYSGGAEGADTAFENGAKFKKIYLPWDGFNGKTVCDNYVVPPPNLNFVKKYHPKPNCLSESSLKLMSRNTYQVLGLDLNSPVDFVLCWTKDGKPSGGTGQALRIAKNYNIPIFNFYYGYEEFANYMIRLKLFKKENK